jgi:hypothetical protein
VLSAPLPVATFVLVRSAVSVGEASADEVAALADGVAESGADTVAHEAEGDSDGCELADVAAELDTERDDCAERDGRAVAEVDPETAALADPVFVGAEVDARGLALALTLGDSDATRDSGGLSVAVAAVLAVVPPVAVTRALTESVDVGATVAEKTALTLRVPVGAGDVDIVPVATGDAESVVVIVTGGEGEAEGGPLELGVAVADAHTEKVTEPLVLAEAVDASDDNAESVA